MKKTVDIIIPVYNTPSELLNACILSAVNQSYEDTRIIIIDDGSTSPETINTLNIYKDEVKVEVYRQDNSGVSTARNLGIEKSTGSYVLFLDSDDILEKDYVERLITIAIKQKQDLVFSGREKGELRKNNSPFRDHQIDIERDSETIVLKSQTFVCAAVLIKGEIARSIRFTTTTTTMGEDTEYIVKAINKGRSYYEGNGGYLYIENSQSLTHGTSIKSIERYLEESIVLKQCFEQYLKAPEETISAFIYLKVVRVLRRLCSNYSFRTTKRIIKRHLVKYRPKKCRLSYIVKNRNLSMGEKIKILLTSSGMYFTVYAVTKLRNKRKVKCN